MPEVRQRREFWDVLHSFPPPSGFAVNFSSNLRTPLVLGPRMTKLDVNWWNRMKIPWSEIPGAAKHCQFAWFVLVCSVEVTTSNGARVSGKARTGWCRHECKIREIDYVQLR